MTRTMLLWVLLCASLIGESVWAGHCGARRFRRCLSARGCGVCAAASVVAKPDPQAVQRPAAAVAFGGHWYLVVPERVSWHEAKKRCEAVGGRLACIGSADEQAFLVKLTRGKYYYLGASDEKQEGVWEWLDGSPFRYTAWYPDQPNNYAEEEHYLATYDDGLWVDVAAAGEDFWMPIGYVCEWDR